MTLADINRKYKGRPLDIAKWQFSGMAKMGSLALAVNDVELDDGCFYNFRATIAMEWSGRPSDILRHGDYGTFANMSAVAVTRNGEAKPLENGGDMFADAIDTMIAQAFGLSPSTKAKVVVVRNDVYPHDYPQNENATREECDQAWDDIKKELVHYTAVAVEPRRKFEDADARGRRAGGLRGEDAQIVDEAVGVGQAGRDDKHDTAGALRLLRER